MMTKAISFALTSIAIFGVLQTSSVAQDCSFNIITFQPPNPASCYLQQSVPSKPIRHLARQGRLNLHARH
jgi:hypothetical protein